MTGYLFIYFQVAKDKVIKLKLFDDLSHSVCILGCHRTFLILSPRTTSSTIPPEHPCFMHLMPEGSSAECYQYLKYR